MRSIGYPGIFQPQGIRAMSSFMQPQITEKQDWIEVDGNCGMEWIPAGLVSGSIKDLQDQIEDCKTIPAALQPYCENQNAYSIELVSGYGARLSAPGYMDCTPWVVYETVENAEEGLRELCEED